MKRFISILLLIVLCLSLWACGNESSGGTSSRDDATDPNGFATKEDLVDAYMRMYTRVISKEEFRKFYKEITWNSGYLEESFDETYANYKEVVEKAIARDKQRFGDDYRLTWEIVSVEDKTQYRDYTEEERQECLEIFGVELEDHHMYEIIVSVTSSGSKDTFTNASQPILVRKLGNKWYLY